MECPKCGYLMEPFDTECKRCARTARGTSAVPPPVITGRAPNGEAGAATSPPAGGGRVTGAVAGAVTVAVVLAALLIQFGIMPQRMDLFTAARRGNEQAVRVLIGRGANVNTRDKQGRTPLHWAAEKGHTQVAQLLLSAGAEAEATDNRGHTPQQLAGDRGHPETARLLTQHSFSEQARRNLAAQTQRNLANAKVCPKCGRIHYIGVCPKCGRVHQLTGMPGPQQAVPAPAPQRRPTTGST